MNALALYFANEESAPVLAERVGCHHTTLYRIAAGKTVARRKLAQAIELETKGKVTAAQVYALAAQGPGDTEEKVGAAAVPVVSSHGGERIGKPERGVRHKAERKPSAQRRQREAFPQGGAK